jgi:hypothetical protein
MASRTGRTLAVVLSAAVALVVPALVSPATAATSTATVKGVISLDGKAVGFAKVQLYRAVYDDNTEEYEVPKGRLKTDNTDSKGRYAFSGLTVDRRYRYIVLVTDRAGKAVKTYRVVTLKKGRTTTKNVHLAAAAILTGTVSTADGRSPAGLTVGVDGGGITNSISPSYEKLFPVYSTTVRANGTFALSGLPRGTYDEAFVADGRYARQCYDFVTNALSDCAAYTSPNIPSQSITLAAGERRRLPAVTASVFAPAASKLTGTVTDTSGKALKGIVVRLDSGTASATTVTRSSGRYTVAEQIPGGSYTIRFDDPKAIWAAQYLGGGPDKAVRQSVTVTPGQAVRGLDSRLRSVSTAKISSRAGSGSAKVAFRIKRKATGSAPGGTLTLSYGNVAKKVTVRKGMATVTLTGLPRGSRQLVADYSGTGSTAGFHKMVRVAVK